MKKVVLFILTLVILLLPGCKNKENDNTLYYPIHIQIEVLDKLNEIESSVSNVTTSEEVEKLINEMEYEIKKLYTPLYSSSTEYFFGNEKELLDILIDNDSVIINTIRSIRSKINESGIMNDIIYEKLDKTHDVIMYIISIDIALIDKKYPDYKKSDDESSYSSGWTDPIPVFFGLE